MTNEKYLVVVSGPSGCGKDTVVSELIKSSESIELSVSCTTRERREHEVEGVDYYFVSPEEFQRRVREGKMLEYVEYAGNMYGTPLDEIEHRISEKKTVVLVIEVKGGATVKALFPDALLIFLKPPSMCVLRKRLLLRGTETRKQICDRIRIARREMRAAPQYDYVVVNDEICRSAREIKEIITKWQEEK